MTAADQGLDPRAARLLTMLRASEGGSAPPVADRRDSLRALAELAADPPPPEVACEALDCPARDGERLPLRRYTPPDANGAAILYVHGGGWVAGDLETHAGVCGALAAGSKASVLALDYRRPPEHPFPGPVQDVVDALGWLSDAAASLGVDPQRIAVAGDSAGANLVASALLDPGAPRPALQVLICPILDLPRSAGSRETFAAGYFLSAERLAADAADYLQGADPCAPRVSPLRADDLSLLPPTVIHAAGFDPFRDEALAYAERLRTAGVETSVVLHPGMIHYFYALARAIPAARGALAALAADIRDRLA